MSTSFQQSLQITVHYLPKLAAGIVVLLVGWLLAAIISRGIQKALARTGMSHHITRWLGENDAQAVNIERRFGRVTYYILLLLVLVGTFQALGLLLVSQPLNQFVQTIFSYVPRILGAGALVLIAYVLANITRVLVRRILNMARFGERLDEHANVKETGAGSMTSAIAETAHWLVYLLFLPGIVGALNIPGLLDPFSSMSRVVVTYLPHLLAAAIILAIGWFLARLVQKILSNLLRTVGLDELGSRVGLAKVMNEPVSSVLGLIAYVLIFIPVLIAALNALQLRYVTAPASHMLNITLAALPHIFAALLIVVIAWFVGRALSRVIVALLKAIGFNRFFEYIGMQPSAENSQKTPADAIGWLIVAATIIFAALEGLQLLGFTLLASLVSQFILFASHILFGVFIIAVGLYLSRTVASYIRQSNNQTNTFVANLARIALIAFFIAIGLREMGVANDIINLAFGITLGAIAVAAAIAFGIGGRDVAARIVNDGFSKIGQSGSSTSDTDNQTSGTDQQS